MISAWCTTSFYFKTACIWGVGVMCSFLLWACTMWSCGCFSFCLLQLGLGFVLFSQMWIIIWKAEKFLETVILKLLLACSWRQSCPGSAALSLGGSLCAGDGRVWANEGQTKLRLCVQKRRDGDYLLAKEGLTTVYCCTRTIAFSHAGGWRSHSAGSASSEDGGAEQDCVCWADPGWQKVCGGSGFWKIFVVTMLFGKSR